MSNTHLCESCVVSPGVMRIAGRPSGDSFISPDRPFASDLWHNDARNGELLRPELEGINIVASVFAVLLEGISSMVETNCTTRLFVVGEAASWMTDEDNFVHTAVVKLRQVFASLHIASW